MNDVQPDPETSREMQAEQVRHLMALLAPGTPIPVSYTHLTLPTK